MSSWVMLYEPTTIQQALQSVEWFNVMKQEYIALMENGTWTLVPPPSHGEVIGNQYIFKVKLKPNITLENIKQELWLGI